MHKYTIKQIKEDLKNKKYSCVELISFFLERIKKFDSKLNSFITVTQESALKQAKIADQKIANNEFNSLTGIPIAHKDAFCTAGIKTSCGSKMLDNFISPYDATVVEKLARDGAIMLGKTNMDEFAMGSSNESSYYGSVKNPWDLQRVPGGSSGGSAACVAARLVSGSTGTDTGGSIRQPAAFCGITGIKPTYGRVSRYGMIAFASSLDQAGIFAQNAEDAALLLQSISCFDKKDSTSVDKKTSDYLSTLNESLKGVTIGLPKEYFSEDISTGTALALDDAITILEKLGAKIKRIELPNSNLAVPTYYIIAPAECSTNLARYDGVRYGYRCDNPKNIEDLYFRSRSEGFGSEVKRRIMIGTYVLSAEFYEAYYLKAQKNRRLLTEDFKKAFHEVDIILTPSTPSTAFRLGENIKALINMYMSDIFTIAVNLAGLPAMSIPIGFDEELPVGMQLIGNYFNEAKLLNVAHKYQLATDWHQKIPENFE